MKNNVEKLEDATDFAGVHEFILVHMAKGDRIMGWLVALNRVLDSEQTENGPSAGDREFGTGQATLLSSAASMLAAHARNVEQFREKEKLLVDMVRALVSAIEAKDEYTCGHSERVALYATCLGRALGSNERECERLYLTGLVHDVGNIGISDATLGKRSHLSDEEFEEVNRHPDMGWTILHDLDQLGYVLPGVVYHHERYDGKGYPDGLAGENIPRDGRSRYSMGRYDGRRFPGHDASNSSDSEELSPDRNQIAPTQIPAIAVHSRGSPAGRSRSLH